MAGKTVSWALHLMLVNDDSGDAVDIVYPSSRFHILEQMNKCRIPYGSGRYHHMARTMDDYEGDRLQKALAHAIENKDSPPSICDGSQYRQAGTSRDRNLLQVSVPCSLGWRIHRVWCLDWWENPEKERKKIEKAIRCALDEPETPAVSAGPRAVTEKIAINTSAIAAEISVAQSTDAPGLPVYERCTLPAHGMDSEAFYDPANNRLILSQLIQVVQKEAPISRTLLCRRVLETWGMTRMGARIDRRFEELLASLRFPQTRTGNRLFFWDVTQEPQGYDKVRVPGRDDYRRNLEEIAPEELAAAVRVVLEQQIGLSEEDLRREVTRLLGFARTTEAMLPALSAGLEAAVQRGIARREGDRIVLAEK